MRWLRRNLVGIVAFAVLVYLFMQRYFISGLTAGSLKG